MIGQVVIINSPSSPYHEQKGVIADLSDSGKTAYVRILKKRRAIDQLGFDSIGKLFRTRGKYPIVQVRLTNLEPTGKTTKPYLSKTNGSMWAWGKYEGYTRTQAERELGRPNPKDPW